MIKFFLIPRFWQAQQPTFKGEKGISFLGMRIK